jgi:hypothetical protein
MIIRAKGGTMSALWITVSTVFVLVVFAALVYGLFRLFGHHLELYRDPQTGGRLGKTPHLESRDEYERTHETGTPHLESRDEYEHHVLT